jgi:hypothetical protein
MSENLTVIKRIMRKHDYVVDVHLTPEGCRAKFPRRAEHPRHDYFDIIYSLDSQAEYVESLTMVDGKCEGKVLLAGPPYAHKALVMFHIMKICDRIRYNRQLMHFWINRESVQEEVFLQALTYQDLDIETLDLETRLIQLAVGAFQNGFPEECRVMAQSDGTLDGYNAIEKLFVNRNPDE